MYSLSLRQWTGNSLEVKPFLKDIFLFTFLFLQILDLKYNQDNSYRGIPHKRICMLKLETKNTDLKCSVGEICRSANMLPPKRSGKDCG